jgi:Flp pilus assembly pilin Flp
MTKLIKKLIGDERAQDLAEYGIALAVIGVGAAVAAVAIATDVNTLWSVAQSIIDKAASSV